MKKTKLIGVVALALALGMVGCGETEEPACEHEYQYVIGTGDKADYHWEQCTKCGEIKDKSEKKHSFKDNADRASENVAATCTEAGSKWQKCACGAEKQAEVKALGHSYTVRQSTTATCTAAGQVTMKCSRCDATELQDDPALGHEWVDDASFTPIDPTCVDKGVKQQKCNRDGCSETRRIETDALGHDFVETKGTPVEGYATLNSSSCKRGDSNRITWDAHEVDAHCENDVRHVVPEEGDEYDEPNYVEEDDGIRFWGRPIRNACVLQENGRPESQSAAAKVFDPAVEGSFFEYKIKLDTAMSDLMFIAEYAPTADLGTGDLYKADSGDWTPGLTSDGQGGSKAIDVRYEIAIDGVALTFDTTISSPCPGTDRAWFTFPTNLISLAAGDHTVKVSMAGGYLQIFYNFGFQTKDVSTGHVHNYIADPTLCSDPDCEHDGRFVGTCECGITDDHIISRLGHILVDDPKDTDKDPTCFVDGQKHVKCTRDGCDFEEVQVLAATGHVYGDPVVGAEAEGFATVSSETCQAEDSSRISWDATEVTDTCKNVKRVVGEGETAFEEPNYVETNDGGVKFWGRPIRNNMELNDSGSATERPADLAGLYDETVTGSYFEYKINVPAAMEDVQLVAYMQPTSDLNGGDLYKGSDSDWTPGLIKIPAEGETPETVTNMDYRYEIKVDSTVLNFQDVSRPCPAGVGGNSSGGGTVPTDWFVFPVDAIDLTAGEHTIRISMAGGYRSTYYKFGFVTMDPEIEPVEPVAEGIKLHVADATGYNNSAEKCKSKGTWTIDSTTVPAGKYSVKINAKCTSTDHTDRKWYNMAKASLCVGGVAEETRTNSPDTVKEDDFRYFLEVDGQVVNPDGKDSWGTLGLNTTEFKSVAFVSEIVVTPATKTIAINHGNVGFSLYIEGIELIKTGDFDPTFQTWDAAAVETALGDSASGIKKTGKSSAKEDLTVFKFGNRTSVEFTYNNEGEARDVMLRIFASTKGSNVDSCQMYRQSINETAPQVKYEVKVNGVAVEYPAADLDKTISDLGLDATVNSTISDNGIVADPVWMDYCVIHLAAGANTITFTKPNNAGYSAYFGGFALAEIFE